MYLKEKTNKIKKLISLVKDENIRKVIADKIKQRGIWIKKAIAIGTLIVDLSMPVAARASSPVEFAWEGLPDVTFEHMVAEANEKDSNVSQDSWLSNVIKFGNFEDGEIKNIFEVEIHNNDNDFSYNGKKILPSELLSDKGQDELLEMLSDIPTLNSVVIKSSLPVSTVLNIKNAGYRTILEANDTAIVGIQEYVQSQGGIAIYGLENESQDVNHEYQNASIKRVIFEDNITKLKQDEMALLSLSIFHRCDKADKADSNGKVCVQIPNVSELSTKEALEWAFTESNSTKQKPGFPRGAGFTTTFGFINKYNGQLILYTDDICCVYKDDKCYYKELDFSVLGTLITVTIKLP